MKAQTFSAVFEAIVNGPKCTDVNVPNIRDDLDFCFLCGFAFTFCTVGAQFITDVLFK